MRLIYTCVFAVVAAILCLLSVYLAFCFSLRYFVGFPPQLLCIRVHQNVVQEYGHYSAQLSRRAPFDRDL